MYLEAHDRSHNGNGYEMQTFNPKTGTSTTGHEIQPSGVHQDEDWQYKGASEDRQDMQRLGKKQELMRNFSFAATFGYSLILGNGWVLSTIGLIVPLANGGTAGTIWMYLVVATGSMFTVLSMAEMASIAPTAGGQYHWVSEFAPKKYQRFLSYLTGWLSVLGWQTALVGTAYSAALAVQGMIALNDPNYAMPAWHGVLLTIGMVLLTIIFNTVLLRKLPSFEGAMLAIHVLAFIVIFTILWVMGDRSPAKQVFTEFSDPMGWGNVGLATLVGSVSGAADMLGGDSAVHLGEEVRDASRVLPLSMLATAVVNYSFIFVMVIALVTVKGASIDELLETPYAQPYVHIYYNVTQSKEGATALTALIFILLFFGVNNQVTTTSRQLWSFARDKGLPWHEFLSRVVPGWAIPLNAVVVSLTFSVVLSLIILGSPVAFWTLTSLCTSSLYASYILCTACVLWRRVSEGGLPPSRFSLGMFGLPCNLIALLFQCVLLVFMFFPVAPNPDVPNFNWAILASFEIRHLIPGSRLVPSHFTRKRGTRWTSETKSYELDRQQTGREALGASLPALDMPFPFAEICTLFQRIENIELREPPLPSDEKHQKIRGTVDSWFRSHRSAISALSVDGATALLSALLPEKRTDRVYGIQAPGLCRLLARCLKLQAHRARDLRAYTQPQRGDLAACLERVLDGGGPPAHPAVSLEEVDDLFIVLAGHSIFSDPSVPRLPSSSSEARDVPLTNILKRLTPCQSKWLLRLVLKDLSPLRLDEAFVLKSFHFLLPDLLRFQANFSSAVTLLKGPLREYPERPDPRSERLLRKQAAPLIKPCVDTKVGRPDFTKARSIEHCLKMLGQQRWVLERKYDGEYCEIHIDLSKSSKPSEYIKIFSKSGKDSTLDRVGIHKTLIRCLRLGRPECKIRQRAIIIGELIVWSDLEKEPMAFDKIRKFVTRSGIRIGTDEDSQRHPHEHLAIAFFDLLLLDEEVIMTKPIEERRQWLREVYTKIEGRALGAQWKVVDFADTEKSRKVLLQQFAASNAGRCEGLVLKPCGVPYFALHSDSDGFNRGFIKLKSDYISEMGDEADFAVIGASYNAQQALKSGLQRLKWTDFHLGTMLNKEDVLRFGSRARFRLVGTIQLEACIPMPILQTANIIGGLSATPFTPGQQPSGFDIEKSPNVKMDTIFDTPFVFEVLGAGFQKASNTDFFMLRHARVKKLHQDRSWKDCISFQELQEQAKTARAAPADSESQETRRWIERLQRKCRRRFEREKTTTPRSDVSSTLLTERKFKDSRLQPRSSLSSSIVSMAVTTDERRPLHNVDANSVQSRSTNSQPHAGNTLALNDPTLMDTRATTSTKRKASTATTTTCPTSKRLRIETNEHIGGTEQRKAAPSPTSDQPQTTCPSTCLLSNTTIYLPHCLRHTPYITQTLLPTHTPSIIIPNLTHWDRASFVHSPLSATVPESQSFPGLRKLVFVESKREEATREVLREVLALNGGRFQEKVEVWDWRVLELLSERQGHDLGTRGMEWFLGATIWDEACSGSVFVWNRAWQGGHITF
ncbi:hypothetical protein Q7P37_000683 [Cladosporium fusiforme]